MDTVQQTVKTPNQDPLVDQPNMGDIDYLSQYHDDIDIEYYLEHQEVSPEDKKIILEKMYDEYLNNIEGIYKDFLKNAAKIRKDQDEKKVAKIVESLGE